VTHATTPCGLAADARNPQDRLDALCEMYESAQQMLHQELVTALRTGGTVSTPSSSLPRSPVDVVLCEALAGTDGTTILAALRQVLYGAAVGRADVAAAQDCVMSISRPFVARHASAAVACMAGEGTL
jgi:hypothetical protein